MDYTVKTDVANRICIPGSLRPDRLIYLNRANAILAIAAAFVLAACATYQPEPLHPQRSAEQFAARRLDNPQLRAEITRLTGSAPQPWPPETWGRAQLLAAALAQNPQLVVARTQIESALAHETAVAQPPNPDVRLQSEYAHQEADHWLYGISFDWLLRTPKRRRLEERIAQLQTVGTSAQLMQQVWQVRRELTAALSDWLGARRERALLESLAADYARLLALQKQRVDAGEDPASELLVSMRARSQIQRQLAELSRSSVAAQAALAAALGVPDDALGNLHVQWPDWGRPPAVAADRLKRRRQDALLGRADLAEAISKYSVAEARLRQAVARQYPQLYLGPGYVWDHGIAKFPFDVGFTLPLNGNRGEIAEARAARHLAAKKMLALQSKIYGELDAAQAREKVARDSLGVAEHEAGIADKLRAQADQGLHLGAIDRSQWLIATVDATRARLEVLRMRAQLQLARDALEDAMHAPLSGPELTMTKPLQSTVSGARR